MGIHQFLTELSACNTSIFSFPGDNLSKYQWVFTKLSICIDIVEIWFGIANGQILSILNRVICPQHTHIFFFFPDDNLSKNQLIFTELYFCIDIVMIFFGIANGQILSVFDRDSCLPNVQSFVSG